MITVYKRVRELMYVYAFRIRWCIYVWVCVGWLGEFLPTVLFPSLPFRVDSLKPQKSDQNNINTQRGTIKQNDYKSVGVVSARELVQLINTMYTVIEYLLLYDANSMHTIHLACMSTI